MTNMAGIWRGSVMAKVNRNIIAVEQNRDSEVSLKSTRRLRAGHINLEGGVLVSSVPAVGPDHETVFVFLDSGFGYRWRRIAVPELRIPQSGAFEYVGEKAHYSWGGLPLFQASVACVML